MRHRPLTPLVVLLTLGACERPLPTDAVAPPASAAASRSSPTPPTPTQTVVAGGLLYPRGIAFGKHGDIYVAEAGVPMGNTVSTVGQCEQVPAPTGPALGGSTGRISRIRDGVRTTLVAGLPSAINGENAVVGVADVALVGDRLYALLDAGCSHGNLAVPSSVIRVDDGGSWRVVSDLSAWIKTHPTAAPEEDDFEPDGDWYSMVAKGDVLYVVEANQGNLVTVKPNSGRVERVADVSATQGHIVPTAVDVEGDDILVGELTTFPAVAGRAQVLRYDRNGRMDAPIGGFTAILGVDTDHRGNVYVLESFTCGANPACFPNPGSGRVTRVAKNGTRQVIATGLAFATALRIGPDGDVYVSNTGYGPPFAGQLVRIHLPD